MAYPSKSSLSVGPGSGPQGRLYSAARQDALDYQRAGRLLRRQAVKGDVRAAMALVDFNRQASEEGRFTSGTARSGELNAGAGSDVATRIRDIANNNNLAQRGNAAAGGGDGGGDGGVAVLNTPSFAEQERIAREKATASGAFGKTATQTERVIPPDEDPFASRTSTPRITAPMRKPETPGAALLQRSGSQDEAKIRAKIAADKKILEEAYARKGFLDKDSPFYFKEKADELASFEARQKKRFNIP